MVVFFPLPLRLFWLRGLASIGLGGGCHGGRCFSCSALFFRLAASDSGVRMNLEDITEGPTMHHELVLLSL